MRIFKRKIYSNYLIYTNDLRKDGDIILLPAFLGLFL